MSLAEGLATALAFAGAASGTGGARHQPTSTIRIGVVTANGSPGDALADGAEAAAAAVNARGGVNGRLLQVARVAPSRRWIDGASQIARLVFEGNVAALVGPTDAAGAHLAAQIATRSRIPVLTLSPEGSLTQAMDPWVLRGVPTDAEQARALLRWTFPDPRGVRALVAIPEGREGRERLASIERACRELGVSRVRVLRARGDTLEPKAVSIGAESADVLLLWLDPKPALALLRALPRERFAYPVLGSLRLDDREFLSHAPSPTGGLAVPLLRHESLESPVAGSTDHHPRLAGPLRGARDLHTRLGYDMVWAIAAAARRAGPEPAGIRDGLLSGPSVIGRSGTFHFDQRGNRRGDFAIGIVRRGTLVGAVEEPNRHDTRSSATR